MEKRNQHITEPSVSVVKNLGENYHYLKTIITNRIEITKLEFILHFSKIISRFITGLVFSILILLASIFLLVALALYISTLVGSHVYGFLIVAFILLLIGLLFYFFVSPILTTMIVKQIENVDQ